jgi:hypothetical protein
MNYDDLSDEEVQVQLRNHSEADWTGRIGNEVIEPRDVLYWLDAFGDLSLAINCQGLPKDLPVSVVKEINEYDVLNDWHGTIIERECPMCNRTLYDFDFQSIHPIIDENGDSHDHIEYIGDHSGYYWDATEQHTIMCQACHDHNDFHGWRPEPSSNSVRVFYGKEGTFSRFSHSHGIIRWDFMWDMDYEKSDDLYNLTTRNGELIEGYKIAAAFAQGWDEKMEMMERIGFEKVHVETLGVNIKGMRKFWRYAKEVLSGWATLDSDTMTNEPTHPDLPFTYIIEGQYQAWVPSEYVGKFKAELIWQSLREAHKNEQAKEWRDSHDDLLSTEWVAA